MARRSPLRRLDDLVVPALRGWFASLASRLGGLGRWERAAGRPAWIRAVASRPGTVAVLAGVVVFAGSGVHLQRVTEAGPPPAPEPASSPLGELAVGPLVGADVEAYRAGRHDVLDRVALDGPARAVVSFPRYLAGDELPELPGTSLEALVLRIPAEGLASVEVPVARTDPVLAVAEALEEQRDALDDEIAEVEALLAEDLGDPDFEADYAERLDELRGARNVVAVGAPVVFGAVVVAEVETLRALVGRDDVRLVDLAGPVADTGDAVFHPVRPEDRTRVTEGRAG
ncbi:hypothetical protein FTX61_12095 [Nitriliruptoraceae bacterium ZYF776]|nr:hypothetical protein [Profundirhabdus halotolerans]